MKYSSGYKYQLREALIYQCKYVRPTENIATEWISLDKDGLLIIAVGYAWDGPSGPTIDTKTGMRGSCIHDAFFQLMRLGLLSQNNFHPANKELYSILLEDGMWKFRAWIWFTGVEDFSKAFTQAKNEPKILEAP